ncbi:hypothetical protein JYP49_14300 [Nitratireductor aquimarinus]|uniref:hypothetical protein n=1 Tax=Nitratireductor TaxID=245876 RepID=UPI0019D39F3D|nr:MULTISPECIES: hypothetical protein [Nitratireductor]MBN7777768.1 hypothetical protein [Nitratireductor pacificus]MBN7781762.1 hypothetical protein [Nitratireductor pacificus]MBN7790568.1 hypothetical protein [Nitratireductor aquimarinus]MBY6099978.1 hypothetical protein [Nitratireductor aquimarinus]MCA1260444.1 hypothetical protein [Nitratireductor aquimarinus]
MKSNYLTRAMNARDPRYRKIAEKLGYGRRDVQAKSRKPVDDMKALRARYVKVVGKKPYHGWDADTLRTKIAEAKG